MFFLQNLFTYNGVIYEIIFEKNFSTIELWQIHENPGMTRLWTRKIAQTWKKQKTYKLDIYHDNNVFFLITK